MKQIPNRPTWKNEKPTKPGKYWILWSKGEPPIEIEVVKAGRGLRIVPKGPWPPVPMSDIEEKELWWREIP